MKLFNGIAKEYARLYNEARGIIVAAAITTSPISEEQAARLTARLEAETGKKIILKRTIDKELIGGIKLRYSGIQLDGSLRSRLENIERRLRGVIV